MGGKIIAGAVVALGLLSSPAFAVTSLGALDPTAFDSASLTGKLPASGSFSLTYTFTLTTTGLVSPGVIITASDPGLLPSGAEFAFYKGVTLLEELPLGISGSTAKVTLATLTEPAGTGYSVVLTGTSNGDLSVGGTVATSPVPEPSTWAMMLIGFMGLGYAAFRHRAKGKLAAAAI